MRDLAVFKDLLARVAAAPESSPEIDARVWHALFPDQSVLMDGGSAGPVRRPAVHGPLRDFPIDGWEDYEGVARAIGAAPITSSLDAAIALIERFIPGTDAWAVDRWGNASIGPHIYNNCFLASEKPTMALLAAFLTAVLEGDVQIDLVRPEVRS